jgi:serine phosphatase RsbU (regulator of sigma subunit)
MEGIAGHAAAAMHSARLYQREHQTALALQHSLLPQRLPDVEGVALAARYVASSTAVEVGGDWFDATVRADGRLVVSIGDVAGHDLQAAAVMGQVRTALRAYAIDASDPAAVVARLERFMADAGFNTFATVLMLFYDPRTGAIEAISAGHLPPLVIGPDGAASLLQVAKLPPVGLGLVDPARRPATPTHTVLPMDSTLLLFTDGLVERRGEDLDTGLERLRQAAARTALPVDELCDYLIKELSAEASRDDTALLALHARSPWPTRYVAGGQVR